MADFAIKAFDRLPSIQATLSTGPAAAPVAVNLTGTTVSFIMRPAGGGPVKVNSSAVLVDAAAGVVRYDWQVGDTDTPGQYEAEWEMVDGAGRTQTFPTLTYHTVDVLADLDGAA